MSLNFSGNTNFLNTNHCHHHPLSSPLLPSSLLLLLLIFSSLVSSSRYQLGVVTYLPTLNIQKFRFRPWSKVNLTSMVKFSCSNFSHVLLWFWESTFSKLFQFREYLICGLDYPFSIMHGLRNRPLFPIIFTIYTYTRILCVEQDF